MFAAIGGSRIRNDDPDLLGRNAKGLRQFIAHRERTLRSRPHRKLSLLPFRQRSSRLERDMGDVGDGIGLVEGLFRCRQPVFHRTQFVDRRTPLIVSTSFTRRGFFQVFKQLRFRRLLRRTPLRMQERNGACGCVLLWRGDSDEVSIANNFNARQLLRLTRV